MDVIKDIKQLHNYSFHVEHARHIQVQHYQTCMTEAFLFSIQRITKEQIPLKLTFIISTKQETAFRSTKFDLPKHYNMF